MKKLLTVCAVLVFTTLGAYADGPPKFFKDTYPAHALKAAMDARAALIGKDAKLDAKTRELISLAVAAQIPCKYCIYGHTKFARANGATEAEIREAVATAAAVRQWSTMLNGMAYSFDAFKSEIDKISIAKK